MQIKAALGFTFTDQLKIDVLGRLVYVSAVKFEGIVDMELAHSQQEAFFDVSPTTSVN